MCINTISLQAISDKFAGNALFDVTSKIDTVLSKYSVDGRL